MGTGKGAAPRGREGNRRSGVALTRIAGSVVYPLADSVPYKEGR